MLNQCKTEIGNSQITNAGGNCVSIIGGDNTFIHCTIGQFYSFVGGRGAALRISNVHGLIHSPISKAFFKNCLITGYNENDINIESSSRYMEEEMNFLFDHCLLNTSQVSDNKRVFACFQKLLFPFTLRANSSLVDKADVNLSRKTFPYDRLGRTRIIDNSAAPGCYAPTPPVKPNNQ